MKVSSDQKEVFFATKTFKFKLSLENASWYSVYDNNDVQSAFSKFRGVIDQHMKQIFKMQTFTSNYKNLSPMDGQCITF